MAKQALAVKYRPKKFEDVCEQSSIVKIFKNMIENESFPNSMLFCGPAGTGKTTCGRIMANEINKGVGAPIEIDAASNSGVDNIRKVIENSKLKSITGDYKVYIIDECHSLSAGAWQALLITLESPSSKTIFILCTTDPQKIPNTILSRVQRYDFQRITFNTIVQRLEYILNNEQKIDNTIKYERAALEYIAKLAAGGMRDAITMMDKCLNLDSNLTVNNVIQALGTQDFGILFKLTNYLIKGDSISAITLIEDIYLKGQDLKQFINQYLNFLLDCCKFNLLHNYDYIQIPNTFDKDLNSYKSSDFKIINHLMHRIQILLNAIKWESNVKMFIEAELIYICEDM